MTDIVPVFTLADFQPGDRVLVKNAWRTVAEVASATAHPTDLSPIKLAPAADLFGNPLYPLATAPRFVKARNRVTFTPTAELVVCDSADAVCHLIADVHAPRPDAELRDLRAKCTTLASDLKARELQLDDLHDKCANAEKRATLAEAHSKDLRDTGREMVAKAYKDRDAALTSLGNGLLHIGDALGVRREVTRGRLWWRRVALLVKRAPGHSGVKWHRTVDHSSQDMLYTFASGDAVDLRLCNKIFAFLDREAAQQKRSVVERNWQPAARGDVSDGVPEPLPVAKVVRS